PDAGGLRPLLPPAGHLRRRTARPAPAGSRVPGAVRGLRGGVGRERLRGPQRRPVRAGRARGRAASGPLSRLRRPHLRRRARPLPLLLVPRAAVVPLPYGADAGAAAAGPARGAARPLRGPPLPGPAAAPAARLPGGVPGLLPGPHPEHVSPDE